MIEYLYYNISNIPDGQRITHAYLYFPEWFIESWLNQSHPNYYTLNEVLDDWDEGSITWNNQPSYNPTPFLNKTWDEINKNLDRCNHTIYYDEPDSWEVWMCFNTTGDWYREIPRVPNITNWSESWYFDVTDFVRDHYETDKIINMNLRTNADKWTYFIFPNKEDPYSDNMVFLRVEYEPIPPRSFESSLIGLLTVVGSVFVFLSMFSIDITDYKGFMKYLVGMIIFIVILGVALAVIVF